MEDSEEEGEDINDVDQVARDYQAIPELDRYDDDELDQSDYSPLSPSARLEAERTMAKRDRAERGREQRIPKALRGLDDDDLEMSRPSRRRRREREEAAGLESAEMSVNIEDLPEGATLQEFITTDLARKEIKRRFSHFLRTFTDDQRRTVYCDKIKRMCDANKQSLEVSFLHLSNAQPVFGIWVADAPAPILEALHEAAMDVVLQLYPNYEDIHKQVYVRIVGLPIVDKLRDIRQVHLNAMVKVGGVVTRRTQIYPKLNFVYYDCGKCGYLYGPLQVKSDADAKVGSCPECQSRGPFSINQERTLYNNYQKMTLQETPGTVPPGRLPRYKDVILEGDLIDCARPGEQVEVTGIYKNNFDSSLNRKNGFPVFATNIEANHISKKDDIYSPFRLTEEDELQIREMAKDPQIVSKIIASIAPSIFGHDDIKTALALSMFGGQPKDIQGKHRIRGDINVLLLGDPGTAKSQFLKYVEKSMPRAVFATGKGASATGLTASVHMDPLTREWTLEGGALVLADTGVCLIDEFDKMSDQDRTSIHEAMEQQSISISKAGIVTTLQARCAVVAAANPRSGRYNSSLHFHENVELTEPILSRFDVLCVVKDTVDPILDTALAEFVVESHGRSHPEDADAGEEDERVAGEDGEGPITQAMLKKYVVYAKRHVHPRISNIDQDKVTKLYSELRRESEAGGGIPIAVRHIESVIRMSEAFARMQLREVVRDDDVNLAIRVMLDSFISSQKYGVQRSLRKSFHHYLNHAKDNNELLFHLLQIMVRDEMQYARAKNVLRLREETVRVGKTDFEQRAKEVGVHQFEAFYESKLFTSKFELDMAAKPPQILRL